MPEIFTFWSQKKRNGGFGIDVFIGGVKNISDSYQKNIIGARAR